MSSSSNKSRRSRSQSRSRSRSRSPSRSRSRSPSRSRSRSPSRSSSRSPSRFFSRRNPFEPSTWQIQQPIVLLSPRSKKRQYDKQRDRTRRMRRMVCPYCSKDILVHNKNRHFKKYCTGNRK